MREEAFGSLGCLKPVPMIVMICGEADGDSVVGETLVIVGLGEEVMCNLAISLNVWPFALVTRTTYSPASLAETELSVNAGPVAEYCWPFLNH